MAFTFLDFGDGGAQRLALETWRVLDPARYRPVLLCVRGRGALVPAAEAVGVPVTVLGRLRRPWDLAAVPQVARALGAAGARVVHVPLYSRVAPYVRLAARWARVPLVVCHEHCRDLPPTRTRRWADRLLLDGRTRFVAVSGADRAWLTANGVPPERVAVVPNGVDTDRFRPRDATAARARLGLPPDRRLVLVPARLERRKGQADLLAALPAVLAQVPDALVLFAGGGPLAGVLPALARSAGLGAAVRFLGPRNDLPEWLAAADVVCLPSRMEGLPLAVLEGMASGRPVVASAVGGVPEAVADGVVGQLVPPRDPPALAAALGALLADPARRAAQGAAGRAVALERFRVERSAGQLADWYDAWLAELALPGAPDAARAGTA